MDEKEPACFNRLGHDASLMHLKPSTDTDASTKRDVVLSPPPEANCLDSMPDDEDACFRGAFGEYNGAFCQCHGPPHGLDLTRIGKSTGMSETIQTTLAYGAPPAAKTYEAGGGIL